MYNILIIIILKLSNYENIQKIELYDLNGKKLPYGQIIDVLQAAVNEVK